MPAGSQAGSPFEARLSHYLLCLFNLNGGRVLKSETNPSDSCTLGRHHEAITAYFAVGLDTASSPVSGGTLVGGQPFPGPEPTENLEDWQ